MKKILTVLLALSVVFTYTVGTAFANTGTPSKDDAESLAAFQKVVADVKTSIGYNGNGYMSTDDNGQYLSKTVVEAAIDEMAEEYELAIAEATSNWDAVWIAVGTAAKFKSILFQAYLNLGETKLSTRDDWKASYANKNIVFTVKDETTVIAGPEKFSSKTPFINYWGNITVEGLDGAGSRVSDAYVVADNYGLPTYENLLADQFAIDKEAAYEALNPDLREYSAAAKEKIRAEIDKLVPTYDQNSNANTAEAYVNAIVAFRDIVSTMEELLENTNTSADDEADVAKESKDALQVVDEDSAQFLEDAQNYFKKATNLTNDELAKEKSLNSDVDKMAAFFEDKINAIVADDEIADAKKVKTIVNLKRVVVKTFKFGIRGDLTDRAGEFYADLAILDEMDVLNAYAKEVADAKKAERNSDGTLKYDPTDVDVCYEAALEAVADAAYAKVRNVNHDNLGKALVDTEMAKVPVADYALEQYKEDQIDAITEGTYNSENWYKGERRDKVEAIQTKAEEDILLAETKADVDSIVKQAKADMDAILNIDEIGELEKITDQRIKALGYEDMFGKYYDAVIGSKGYSEKTKTDAIGDAKQVMKDAVVATEDAELPRAEIDKIIKDTYNDALAVLVDVNSDAELAELAKAVDTKIEALTTIVTIDDKDAILDAKVSADEYLDLAGAQITDIKNRTKLNNAMDDLMYLESKAVRDMIRALPTSIDVDDAEAIQAARAAYDALVDTYEDYGINLPSNIGTLENAEAALEAARLSDAIDKVSALGSDPTEAEVVAARAAYNLLSIRSKLKFNDELYADLLKAEASLSVNVIKSVESLKIVKNHSEAGKGWIKIMWSTVGDDSHVDGYEIYRSTKKNSGYGTKPIFTTKNPANKWYKNTAGLKKGTRYYYKVRAFVEIDGQKYYSDWSNKAYRIAK